MNDKFRKVMFGLLIFFGILAFSVGRLIMAGVAFLLAIGMYMVAGGGNYNDRNISDKIIARSASVTVEQIYEKIKDQETFLGTPWMSHHRRFEEECIVLGPSVFKDYIVIGKEKDTIRLSSHYDLDKLEFPENQEWRRDAVIDAEGLSVTPKRYSSFASYKVMTAVLLDSLTSYLERLVNDESAEYSGIPEFHLFHYNTPESIVRDPEGNQWAKTSSVYDPLSVIIYDMDGNEAATATGNPKEPKKGFPITLGSDEYGVIYHNDSSAHDEFYVRTEDGEFRITSFRAVRSANVSSNYTISLDGEMKAVVACSPRIEFDSTGQVINDIIMSLDDEHLLFYILVEEFLMAHNRFVK